MLTLGWVARDFRRCASLAIVALIGVVLNLSAPAAMAGPTQEKFPKLSQKEITFLKTVFSGDEAKAAEYAELAGINPSAIGGEPLSVWFYDMDEMMAPGFHRNLRVQKIVFERFKQNPNPPLQDPRGMQAYCAYAPTPRNLSIEWNGTPQQKQIIGNAQDAALKQHIDAMVAGFDSLRRYGLRDRAILKAMLPGCVYPNPGAMSEYIYDQLVTKLLAAGADINHVGAQFGRQGRPIELAVQRLNVPIMERLLRDGAQVKFNIRVACAGGSTNLYGYFLDQVKTPDPQRLAHMIALLNAAGLPYQAPVVAANGFGFTYCRPTTLYNEAINAGNLNLAKAIKEAVAATPAAMPLPAAVNSAQPAVQTASIQSSTFGIWSVAAGQDGRPVATNNSQKNGKVALQGLRLECVAGGHLEYVPMLAGGAAASSLWVNGMDDIQSEVPLANGRAIGKSASWLSQEFLKAEANALKTGQQARWGLSMVSGDPNRETTDIDGPGFSKMRSYMLAHCKG